MIDWASISLAIINIIFFINIYLKRTRKPGEPALVAHRIPFVGAAFDFGKNPDGYLKKLQKEHGDVFSIKIAGWNYHIFMNPLDVGKMEVNRSLSQDPVLGDFVTRMVGVKHSILNQKYMVENKEKTQSKGGKKFVEQDADQHKKDTDQHKVSQAITNNLRGSLQLQSLYNSTSYLTNSIMRLLLDKKIQGHQCGDKVDLFDLCNKLIFHMTFKLLFGYIPDEDENLKETNKMYEDFSKFNEHSALLVDRVPINLLPKTKWARSKLFEILGKIDWSKRVNISEVVKQTLKADENKENQTRHLLVLLWAAQANTTPGLFWMLFYLIKDPEAMRNILLEYDIHMKTSSASQDDENEHQGQEERLNQIMRMEKADLDKLLLLDSAFKEMSRISGSSMVVRIATNDTSLMCADGKKYSIRKGDYTMFYSPILHLDEEVYENPTEFHYDRFVEEIPSESSDGIAHLKQFKNKTKFYKDGRRLSTSRAIMTFGMGEQRCPGRHLAAMEIKLLTLSLLKCFKISLETETFPNLNLYHIGFGLMPPKDKVFVTMTPRLSESAKNLLPTD